METTKLERTGNLNPAPDGRVDPHQRDFELVDRRRGLRQHCNQDRPFTLCRFSGFLRLPGALDSAFSLHPISDAFSQPRLLLCVGE